MSGTYGRIWYHRRIYIVNVVICIQQFMEPLVPSAAATEAAAAAERAAQERAASIRTAPIKVNLAIEV